jgi:hypothetical protein
MTLKYFLNSHASLFYQREPDGSMSYIDEVSLTDVRMDGREPGSPFEVPDRARRGDFNIATYTPGSLILPGFSCMRPHSEINRLWQWTREGKMNFHINYTEDGTETDKDNYHSKIVFVRGEVVSPALDGGKAMQSGDASVNMTSMQVQSVYGYEVRPLSNASRQTTAEDQQGNSIWFAPAIYSGTLRRRQGQHGVVTVNAVGAGTANVSRTIDYGGTWTAATADPFAADEHAGWGFIIDLPQTDQYRVIVFRTVTDAANPSECAYTDVTPGTAAWGASWSTSNIGSTNAYFITSAYKVHDGLILAGDDQGNMYYSTDKGVSWTAASYGGSNDVRWITAGPGGKLWAGGDGTEVYYSEDDGVTWTAVTTAPAGAVTGVAINYEGHVYIIDNTTLLKRSTDNGLSWTAVTVTSDAVTELKSIQFDEQGYTGTIIVDDAGADDRIYRTTDGGVSWTAITTGTSNTGYNGSHLINHGILYVVGDVVTTTWIEKVTSPGMGS